MDLRKQWCVEYSRKRGIPSSFREEPGGSVVYFHEFLKKQGITRGRLLDLGCGKGRHAFYFAKSGFEVSCIDFVPELIEEIKRVAEKNELKIKAVCQSVTDRLPFPENHFDAAIDLFCYKHLTSKEKQAFFRKELHRVLKGGSYYLLTLAGDDDAYYGQLLANSSDPKNKLVVDPANGIASFLYTPEELEKEFSPLFRVVDFVQKKKLGQMHGREYLRSTLVFIMRKRL